ncbi:hypothetical protein AC482_02380 [miscellaneous Crenarchaeota group-15 archaeon DG-45]|uniref:N-acetyltransferase domain-containing protein n=1 Tax=miscellaneous Crenarchaeota group-15 archaeon DG-45 TaxID=1685127 RepID=A0A0M0BQX1_9ARCH|nr:MAG: hypothetical protein AC482_02380 [miscellaneous Crenarchaeota group-15 archaeon DG-45]
MDEEMVALFENALRAAEERLSGALGEQCRVRIALDIDEGLLEAIQQIEREMFRPELRYTAEELEARRREGGFVLFQVVRGGRVIAFLFGYTESTDTPIFFLDTVATLVEGKGLGSMLVSLALLYCYDTGYGSVELFTEEEDEKGRRLADFYGNFGFSVVYRDPAKGIRLRNLLDPEVLRDIYREYIEKTESPRDFQLSR